MKKLFSLFVLSLSLMAASAQRYVTLDQLSDGWAQKNLTGVKDGNILTLLTAFNKVWPTTPATELLKRPITNNDGDTYDIVVDRPNGYVSAQELGDDGEDIAACVWKRSNGHKLFAVVYTRYHGLFPHPIALFYDYDAAKQTLTPEPNELSRFKPAYTDATVDVVHIQLPQHGKDVVVQEYLMGWHTSIKHTYKWDGMSPRFSHVNIEHLDKMRSLYDVRFDNGEVSKFTKFALYDFDEDDNPELWLSSENEEYQAIFSIVAGDIQMLSATYYKTHFMFHPNVIGAAGGCGTGCFSAEYVIIEKSKAQHTFVDFQEYNYETDEVSHSYSFDDKDISTQEGEHIIDSFGEPQDVTPQFQPLFAAEG